MKKRVTTILCLALLAPIISTLSTVYAENITPIESVEWGTQTEEASEEVDEEIVEEVAEESIEETQDTTVTIDTSSPLAFLEGMSQLDPRSVEYVYFVSEGEAMNARSQNSLKDGEKYYTAQLTPPFLPSAVFFKSDRQAIQEAYLSVDDLIQYAADALNTQPQIYAETIVEDFYVFAQENYEDLQGKVVQLDSTEMPLNQDNLEMLRVEDYLTAVSLEWLSHEEVQNAFEENEMGQQVMINGEIGALFNEIAQAKQADYPELSEFFAEAASDIEGTINVDYTNQVFGIGLVATNGQEQVTGMELYLLANAGKIIDFSEDIIFSQDEFKEFVGFDAVQEITEFEASLTPDMFETTEE